MLQTLIRRAWPLAAALLVLGISGCATTSSNRNVDSDNDGIPDIQDDCGGSGRWVRVNSNGCPADDDYDGVYAKKDRCPNTPYGAPVDAHGCPFESDGDGVLDHLDRCPATPKGQTIDASGCPLDSDGDGIPDDQDACKNEKAARVGKDGCAVKDSDGDGVPDGLDKCPGTPKGYVVDADGCPTDSDGDGVPDALDQCPGTARGDKVLPNGCSLRADCRRPETGEPVDANGCADPRRFVLRGVNFEFDSDELTPRAREILDAMAETFNAYPQVQSEVQGHTDAIGTDAYNQALSERRAKSVVRYLGSRGIDPSRLTPNGFGESAPVSSNQTDEGRELNRRVEFRITDPAI